MWVLIIVLVVVVLFVVYLVATYNGLVKSKNQVESSWAQIDVQLKRRLDLIPNLVETVKGYAAHEKRRCKASSRPRNKAMTASTVADQAAADNMITGALNKLFALQEAYPDLKANQNFLALQEELTAHRGSRRLCAAVLQRRRDEVQHEDRDVPDGHLRRDPALHRARVLRGRRLRTRSPEGRVLVPVQRSRR